MLFALVCLWVGFAGGFVCAALMRGGSERTARRYARGYRFIPSAELARMPPSTKTRAGARR